MVWFAGVGSAEEGPLIGNCDAKDSEKVDEGLLEEHVALEEVELEV